jgi:hypothetical protein
MSPLPNLGLLLEAIALTIYQLAVGLGLAVLLVAFLLFVERGRRRHRPSTVTITVRGDFSKVRQLDELDEALRPIGGSYRNCEDPR